MIGGSSGSFRWFLRPAGQHQTSHSTLDERQSANEQTTMLLNGIDVRTAAGRLGHARASTTLDIYAHYPEPADRRASEMLASSLDGRH